MGLTWKSAWEPPLNRAWNLVKEFGGADLSSVELPRPVGAAQHGRQQSMNFRVVFHSPFEHSVDRAA
jgi:hypothetical protein